MIADLVLAYALNTNDPLFLREQDGALRANTEIRLETHYDFTDELYLDIAPYVIGHNLETMGRAGERVAVGYRLDNLDVELFHQSEHNLDRFGQPLEIDGIRLRIKLNGRGG